MSLLQILLGKPYTSSTSFVLGLLLFFLPFVELKCKTDKKYRDNPAMILKDMVPVKMTGFGMITGQVKTENNSELTKNFYRDFIHTVPFAVIAFLVGLMGFIFSVIDFRGRGVTIVVTGTIAAICLIVVRLRFVKDLNRGLHLQHLQPGNVVEVNFTVWFYLSMISFAIAALLGYFLGLFALGNKYYEEEFEF